MTVPVLPVFQTTLVEELGSFEAAPQPPGRVPGPEQPSLSPEELLLAVSRIKQERADTPPVGGAVGGAAEDLRCVLIISCQVKTQLPSATAAGRQGHLDAPA